MHELGFSDKTPVERVKLIMDDLKVTPENQRIVVPVREAAEETEEKKKGHKGSYCGAALELAD